jgi:thiol-disulfide isomerase/thioredoxin
LQYHYLQAETVTAILCLLTIKDSYRPKLTSTAMKKHLLSILIFLAIAPLVNADQEGQLAPQCAAELAGSAEKLDIRAYKGKVVLIDFWATWCPPCKKSIPFFNSLHSEYEKDNFEIIAINVDEDSEEAKQFLESNPVNYIMAFDPKGDCPAKFEVKAMPSSYLVDKTGKIRKVHLGFRDEDKDILREQVSAILAE